jgi:hypothetical protein
MSRTMIAVFLSAGLGFAGVGMAQMHSPVTYPAPMSKADYTQAVKDADAQYKIDKKACASLSGNAKDICAAEATGNQKVAKAQAEAAYKHAPKDREHARIAYAEANYKVAIERCDDLAGNPKDVCVKEAKSALVKGKADAKVDRVATDANREAAATTRAKRSARPSTRSRSRSSMHSPAPRKTRASVLRRGSTTSAETGTGLKVAARAEGRTALAAMTLFSRRTLSSCLRGRRVEHVARPLIARKAM